MEFKLDCISALEEIIKDYGKGSIEIERIKEESGNFHLHCYLDNFSFFVYYNDLIDSDSYIFRAQYFNENLDIVGKNIAVPCRMILLKQYSDLALTNIIEDLKLFLDKNVK